MRKLMMASFAALAASSLCATDMVVRTDWAKSFTVTFSGYEGESTLSGFPALVRIGSSVVSGFSYGDFALENGADLCFADENGVVIPHEIDTWNQNGESLVWVRVPSMKTNAVITAYYGNANAAGVTASDTWAGYAGVWHMGTGSGGTVADAAGHDGLAATPVSLTATTGPVGVALYGDVQSSSSSTSSQRLSIPSYSANMTDEEKAGAFTVSGWFRHKEGNHTSFSAGRRLLSRKTTYSSANGWEVYFTAEGSDSITVRGANTKSGSGANFSGGGAFVSSDWFHLVLTIDGKAVTAYANGSLLTKTSESGMSAATDNGQALGVGNYNTAGGGSFAGSIDEVRIRPGVVADDWAIAEYHTVAKADFAECGPAETPEAAVEPGIVTGAASDMTQTTAHLAGIVSAFGSAEQGTVYVDYGPDVEHLTSYEVGTVSELGAVSADLENLTPDTAYVYAFRIVAGGVTATGDFGAFRTLSNLASFAAPTATRGDDWIEPRVSLTQLAASDEGTVVSLYVSTDAENFGEPVKTFPAVTDLETVFTETVGSLSPLTTYYYKFKAVGEKGGDVYTSWSEVGSIMTAGTLVWTGAAESDDGFIAGNWTPSLDPRDGDFGLNIGLPNGTNVTMTATSANGNWANATVLVAAGAKLTLLREAWSGSATYTVQTMRNQGTVEVRGAGTSDSVERKFTVSDCTSDGIFNAAGAELRVVSPDTGKKNHQTIYAIPARNRNDGSIVVEHGTDVGASARLVFSSPGAFENNGRITLRDKATNPVATGFAALVLGDGSTNKVDFALTGSGRVVLDISSRTGGPGESDVISLIVDGKDQQRLTNDVNHVVEGSGMLRNFGIENHGVIRAFDPRVHDDPAERAMLQLNCYHRKDTARAFGSAIHNLSDGRIVAMESSGGILIGHPDYYSTFTNEGLLEARTGSRIEIRIGATEATGRDTTTNKVAFGGIIAGDGTITTHQRVELKPGAVVRPGNLALNASGEDDGLGASLVGNLAFTTNVTFKAGSSLEIQGNASGRQVDGITVDGSVVFEDGAQLKLLGSMPQGTHRLISSSLPIEGDIEVVRGDGVPKFTLERTANAIDITFTCGLIVSIR